MKMLLARNLPSAPLCAALLCCASPAYAATCAPEKLVHIVATDVTPGISSASFGAQSKSLYRVGNDKVRIEEALDSANGIHAVIVVAEPNIWMANLYDKTGKHIVDPGPTFIARAPVFPVKGLSAKLLGLEFGCEADFFAANAPTPIRSDEIGNTRLDVYRIEDGADALEILEQPGSNTPVLVRHYRDGKLTEVLRYDVYVTGLPNDPGLFIPPTGIRYTEPRQ
jgi:hypothetical protein